MKKYLITLAFLLTMPSAFAGGNFDLFNLNIFKNDTREIKSLLRSQVKYANKKDFDKFNLMQMSYKIYGFKNNKSKLVTSVENKRSEYVKTTGFIKSPYEDRIALVVANAEYVFEGDEVFVNFYGCNLSVGF